MSWGHKKSPNGDLLPRDRQHCRTPVRHKGPAELLLLLIPALLPQSCLEQSLSLKLAFCKQPSRGPPRRARAQGPAPGRDRPDGGQPVLLCHPNRLWWRWLRQCHLFSRHSPVSRCAAGALPERPDPAGAPAREPGFEHSGQGDLQPQ